MPLRTAITRDGSLLSLRWGDFHIAAMVLATAVDSGQYTMEEAFGHSREEIGDNPVSLTRDAVFTLSGYGPVGKTALNNGSYTLRHGYKFRDEVDDEIFIFEPGDVLEAWRE